MHTSTITVAIFDGARRDSGDVWGVYSRSDIEETAYRASGKGGQHRNKKSTAVRLIHRPTKIMVCAEKSRDYQQNRKVAWAEMARRLQSKVERERLAVEAASRKDQVGSGERGDKRRTVAVQRDEVFDNISGWRTTYKKYKRGEW